MFRYGRYLLKRWQLKFARQEVKGQRICELYDDGESITEIAKIMSLNRRYVRRWLKAEGRI